MSSQLKLLLDTKKGKSDLNAKVIELIKKEPKIGISSSIFSAVDDAEQNKEKIFKIKKPIKSEEKIPKMIFL